MDEKSVIDLTIDELVARHRLVKTELQKRFKKTRPLRMEPVSDEELLQRYENTTQEEWAEIMSTHDPDDVEKYRNKMENLKIKKGMF